MAFFYINKSREFCKKNKFILIFLLFFFLLVSPTNVRAGTLTNFSYSATSYVANTRADYTFTFTNETAIPQGNIVADFNFDSSFNLDSAEADIFVNGVQKIATVANSNNDLTLQQINVDIDPSSVITVIIHNVLNSYYSGTYSFNFIGNDSDSVASIDPVNITINPNGSMDTWSITPIDTSASISWNADTAFTNAIIQYGITQNYGLSTGTTFTSNWSANLVGLSPSTTYNFRVIMDDGNGHFATSTNQTFETLNPFFAGGDGTVDNPYQINSTSAFVVNHR